MIPSRTMSEGRRKEPWVAWAITWLAYATYYLGRKGFSVAKKPIESSLGISRAELAWIDTAHLATYAVGQFACGLLGDRVGARRLVGWGMLLSAAMCAWFGAGSSALVFVLAFGVNGLAQSTGWPGTTRAMAEWTTQENRRKVMAIWATCYQVGGIAATGLAAWLLRFGWRASFFVPALALLVVGALVLSFLEPGPNSETPPPDGDAGPSGDERRAAVRKALTSPVLWCFGASYFSIKLVRYSLMFWLPYYLSDQLGYDPESAGYLSASFDVGGIVGVVGTGLFTHRVRGISRSALACAVLAFLSLALFGYTRLAPLGWLPNALGLAVIGVFLYAPDSLISGAVVQDIGGPHATATATGLVNGVGSIGAIFQGFLNVWLSRRFGWDAVFVVFIVLTLVASATLLPTIHRKEAR